MRAMIVKALDEMSEEYYLGRAYFGMLPLIWALYMALHSNKAIGPGLYMLAVVNAVLFPYACLAYEKTVRPVLNGKAARLGAPLALLVKAGAMAACWFFAIPTVLARALYRVLPGAAAAHGKPGLPA